MDATSEPIFDSGGGEERAAENQDNGSRLGQEDTARPDLIWLDSPILITHAPTLTSAKLYGIYRPHTNIATISLIITHDGTDYRVVRYHKPVATLLPIDEERLGYIHNNMVNHFMNRYGNTTWEALLNKFTKWSHNQLYTDALRRL